MEEDCHMAYKIILRSDEHQGKVVCCSYDPAIIQATLLGSRPWHAKVAILDCCSDTAP